MRVIVRKLHNRVREIKLVDLGVSITKVYYKPNQNDVFERRLADFIIRLIRKGYEINRVREGEYRLRGVEVDEIRRYCEKHKKSPLAKQILKKLEEVK